MSATRTIDLLLVAIGAGALAVAIWSVCRMEELRRPASTPAVRRTIYHPPAIVPAKPLEAE